MSSKGAKLLGFLVLVLVLAAGGIYFYNAEGQAPRISLEPDVEQVNKETEARIEVADKGSGLSAISIRVVQEGEESVILQRDTRKRPASFQRTVAFGEMGLDEGPFSLQIKAVDSSWSNLFRGNSASLERSFVLDNTPPRVEMKRLRHNLRRGGSGMAVFKADEELERAGVSVGRAFFPGYKQQNGAYLALFSYPYDVRAGEATPLVTVRDRAGNSRELSLRFHVNERRPPESRIRIPQSFLDRKMPQFRDVFPDIQDKLELFLAVNEKLREQNRVKLRELGRDTSARPLWSGKFLRQPDASRQSSFAVKRIYYHQSEKISEATHVGIDLASVARAEVPAANAGQVVYAEWLGIYGQSVVIDHGLGLQSLYGHLSEIGVEKGQKVSKGEIIGRTGATGLAGGDHLHFEMLASGQPVTPVQWWDAQWIKHNIAPKLEKAAKED